MNDIILNLKKIINKIIKNNFWRDRFNLFTVLTSLLLNLGLWLFLILRLEPSEYPVPLHFNIYFGVDVIDSWKHAFFIPVIGISIIIINLILSYLVFEKEKFMTHFLLSCSLFVQVLLFLAGIGVVVIR